MTDNRKEQERAELHRVIWDIACNIVHAGTVDQSEFKQYVLGVMFYRYISENLTEYVNQGERAAGNIAFDYTKMADEQAEAARGLLINKKGFFILPSELFCNVQEKAAADGDLNQTLARIFKNIENSAQGTESENDFKGLFDDVDVNSNKLGGTVAERNKTLVMLLDGIAQMKLGNYQDTSIDVFGDAYEYLISMYASSAGKKGGEFYTPQEVSELLTRITLVGKTEVNKVYDPAVGSGSLLLNFAKILGKDKVRQGFFGQEKNITTYNLCRINMFLHNISYDKFNIAHGDTLINPQHWDDEPFDAIVSNPPYSVKWEGDANPVLINDPRFSPAGILAPKGYADLAFIMHSLSWLSTKGTAAIVCFPGIMYRGGAEKKIRQYLIDNNYIDCVIQLPQNLFFGTSIATCIMVLKKSKAENKTLFIDGSKEFIKVTNNNKLTKENIETILNGYIDRADKEYFSRLVSNAEIAENDYNLTVSTYVEPEDTRQKVDIVTLNAEIAKIVAQEQDLRREKSKIIATIETEHENILMQLMKKFCPDGIEYKTLGEIAIITRGGNLQKKDLTENGIPCIHYGQIYTRYGLSADKTISFIAPEIAKKQRTAMPNDIIMAVTSENIDDVCKCVAWLGNTEIAVSGHTAIIHHEQDAKYLSYYFHTEMFQVQKRRLAHGTKVIEVTPNKLNGIKIPVPPLEVQKEIVRILDKYSDVVTALNETLSAELTSGQKQYEYYRDKLLAFKAVSE